MIRTYDIDDVDMALIKEAIDLSGAKQKTRSHLIEILKPVCDADERLVCSVQAFREFHSDSGDEDVQWALETADDEVIGNFIGGTDGIYNAWAQDCDMAMTELLHHLNKIKETT